jgi:hypothetical protein
MIILIGFALAAIFTLALWRFGGSLTAAGGSIVLFGGLVFTGAWALSQPWATDLIQTLVSLRDDLGGLDPHLAIWGSILIGVFGFVVIKK